MAMHKSSPMQTVFVTGASGFIGTHLVRELVSRGLRCKCLVRATSNTSELPTDEVELIRGSIEDPDSYRDALEGCDTVLHLAGRVSATNEAQFLQVNADACAKLADACLETRQPPRFIFVSSIAAAGPPPQGTDVREETQPANPISHYGRSKRKGELLLAERADKMPITIVRPGIVYGPCDKNLFEIVRTIHRLRLHFVVGFRTPPLSFIYVDDLIQLIFAAVARGETLRTDPNCSEGIYFASDDSEFPTYRELGQRLAKSLDRSVLVWPLLPAVAKGVGFAAQTVNGLLRRSSLLTVDKVREATVTSWATSSQKAQQQLGFTPTKSLDENLRQTSQWYADNGWV